MNYVTWINNKPHIFKISDYIIYVALSHDHDWRNFFQKGCFIVVNLEGNMHWLVDGLLHREDGPAIEDSDGSKYWYIKGKRHRENGPAIEYPDGDKLWYVNGDFQHSNTMEHISF